MTLKQVKGWSDLFSEVAKGKTLQTKCEEGWVDVDVSKSGYLLVRDVEGSLRIKPDALDLTKPVQTRRGGKVTIFATDLESTYPILGVEEFNGGKRALTWMPCGGCPASGSSYELINVPEKPEPRTIWAVDSQPAGLVYRLCFTQENAEKICGDIDGTIAVFKEVM